MNKSSLFLLGLVFLVSSCGGDAKDADAFDDLSHSDNMQGVLHGVGKDDPLSNCAGCHGAQLNGGEKSCYDCHNATDHDRNRDGVGHMGKEVNCERCHGPDSSGGLGPACEQCH